MFINETLKTKITKEYDVIVCGGGFAGISASLASARMGKKTLLLEKMYMLGGLGTAGIVTIYLPLCDGFGKQVSFGIAEELLRFSISEGCEARYPENWLDGIGTRGENDKRFEVQYNPHIFAMKIEKFLLDAGVDIMYGTYAVAVDKNDDKIEHIIVENKSGRYAYKTKSVVDATGDCDIALFADAPTDTFEQGNILAAWYYSLGKDGYNLRIYGAADIPDEEKVNGNKTEYLVDRRFSGLDAEEISEMVCLSHRATFNNVMKKRKEDESYIPVTMTSIPQIRMTRKIVGEYVLKNEEVHKYFEDSIGMVSNWKKRGPVYEVPFRTLYSGKVKNLICAGRCTSTDQTLWDVMRVIPCCAVTGEAAGTAAAMTDDFTSLDVKELQKILVNNGVVLHENDLKG
ncbi:MAG: FAD-dependent oxidoreductase [Ruminococcaceae bacterium]|nr:FAD-dependent oxidoreductase [Oscillospiraceae bacterium]